METRWYQEKLIEQLEELKNEYFNNHFIGTDADGDGVEWEESDDYCITINNIIDAIKEGEF